MMARRQNLHSIVHEDGLYLQLGLLKENEIHNLFSTKVAITITCIEIYTWHKPGQHILYTIIFFSEGT